MVKVMAKECGCKATASSFNPVTWTGILEQIEYCPMHEAAPQLLEALKPLAYAKRTAWAFADSSNVPYVVTDDDVENAKTAIAAATGADDA